jgi:HTH-type transcriptional regulator/antitoxin HipB
MLTYVHNAHRNAERLMRSLNPKDIGTIVRQARIDAGLTQEGLATKIGASRYWVAEFERGKTRAELGLALKALRALHLILTIAPSEKGTARQTPGIPASPGPATRPRIDLSALLARVTK